MSSRFIEYTNIVTFVWSMILVSCDLGKRHTDTCTHAHTNLIRILNIALPRWLPDAISVGNNVDVCRNDVSGSWNLRSGSVGSKIDSRTIFVRYTTSRTSGICLRNIFNYIIQDVEIECGLYKKDNVVPYKFFFVPLRKYLLQSVAKFNTKKIKGENCFNISYIIAGLAHDIGCVF